MTGFRPPDIASSLLFASLALAGGCGGRSAKEPLPVVALAQSRAAQEAFRGLRQRFVGGGREQRAALEPNLRWFVMSYPKDGEAPLAKVYLAQIALDRGDVDRARELVREAETHPSGSTRDLAELVDAAVALERGAPAQAFDALLPLVGKLIDPYARVLLDEKIVAAALGARRWYEAVAYMDLWLRDAPEEDAGSVRAAVGAALAKVPSEALELMLKAMQTARAGVGYGKDIRKAVVARLSGVALEQQDTELARRLVESASSTQVLGDDAEGLEELASSGGAPVVDGRVIGLLISTGSSHLGPRAAEVLTGVVDALRGAQEGAPDAVRLTTRDERETTRTELSLLALVSHGASVLIAGLDPAQAEVAANFAEHAKVPLILLSPPADGKDRQGAFVIGDSSGGASALLSALAAHRARTVAPVGGAVSSGDAGKIAFLPSASCNMPIEQAGESRFPIGAWRTAKVDCLLLLGDPACASDAIEDAALARIPGLIAALGLDAAELAAEPSRLPLVVASAGKFPLVRTDTSSPLYAFKKRNGKAPSWYTALGHDAAVLARTALRALPTDRTEEKGQVEKRHEAARAALAGAEADLWTTDSRGFQGRAVMTRASRVVEVR